MAKGRWLKPEYYTDKKMSALSDDAFIVYPALWQESDDGDVTIGAADLVFARKFFRRGGWTVKRVQAALDELVRAGRALPFEHRDEKWLYLPRMMAHQGTKEALWRHLGKEHKTVLAKVLERASVNGKQHFSENAAPGGESGPPGAESPPLTPKPLPVPIPEPKPIPKKSVAPAATAAAQAPKQHIPRETWLTSYWQAWVDQYGGHPPGGALAKAFKPLHDAHGAAVLPRWRKYLSETEAQFASPARFAATYGAWGPKHERTPEAVPPIPRII